MKEIDPTYINMCDTPFVQDPWKPEENQINIFYVKSGYYTNGAEPCNGEYWVSSEEIAYCGGNDNVMIRLSAYQTSGEYIWLPLQCQIQEMCEPHGHFKPPLNRLIGFFTWCHETIEGLGSHEELETVYTSMDQLWLAFYMNQRHGLTWDGEKWI